MANATCATASLIPTPLPQVLPINNAAGGPDETGGACFGIGSLAIWYQITLPPYVPLQVVLDDSSTGEGLVSVFTGTCGSLVFVTCDIAGATIVVPAVNVSQTVFLEVMSFDDGIPFTGTLTVSPVPLPDAQCDAITPAPGALATVLSIACDTQRVTIQGTNFAVGAAITLTSPDGAPIPFTLLNFSETTIVVQVTEATTGQYCATVTNPATFT